MLNHYPKLVRNVAQVLVLCFVLSAAACTQSQITRAAKASNDIADYTGQTITLVRDFYLNHAISLEVKDQLADKLSKFSTAGGAFNDLVKLAREKYKDGALPSSVWADLTTQFDALTKIFVEILTLVPQAAGLKDSKAFKIITASVLAISQILMQNGVNYPQFKTIERQAHAYGLA
jgi:hypothetical protein